jgi:hypothetical protein
MRCVYEDSGPGLEPETPAPTRKKLTPKEIIIEVLNTYSLAIQTRVEAELRRRGFTISEFCYTTSTRKRNLTASRFGAAWQIALSGGWELPKYTGQPFLVNSQETDSQYQVYCAAADKLGGFCKHSIAAYMVFLACKALEANQLGQKVAA